MLTKVWNYVMNRVTPAKEVQAKPYRTRHTVRMEIEEEGEKGQADGAK